MRFNLTAAPPSAAPFGARQPNRRVALAMCLLVHLLLIYIYRQSPLPAARAQTDAPGALIVWLSPLAAPPQAAPARHSASSSPAVVSARKTLVAHAATVAIPANFARGDSAAIGTMPSAAVETSSASAASASLTFDMQAARDTARAVPAQKNIPMSGAQIDSESKLSKAISGARRGNCNDGVPGGLLAPLLMLSDKKDSGCKW